VLSFGLLFKLIYVPIVVNWPTAKNASVRPIPVQSMQEYYMYQDYDLRFVDRFIAMPDRLTWLETALTQ